MLHEADRLTPLDPPTDVRQAEAEPFSEVVLGCASVLTEEAPEAEDSPRSAPVTRAYSSFQVMNIDWKSFTSISRMLSSW